jgi:hypothetical protein
MAPIAESLANEFREEAATTKRVLDRVPAQKLSWQPHSKSMTLAANWPCTSPPFPATSRE